MTEYEKKKVETTLDRESRKEKKRYCKRKTGTYRVREVAHENAYFIHFWVLREVPLGYDLLNVGDFQIRHFFQRMYVACFVQFLARLKPFFVTNIAAHSQSSLTKLF